MSDLQVERVAIETLHEDPDNARGHSDRNILAIEGSLRTFGQVEPLVVQRSSNRVIGGNGRLRAMQAMGWNEADVAYLDIDDIKARALSIALNRTAELAEWNWDVLTKHLKNLQPTMDLADIGWDPDAVNPLLQADFSPSAIDPGATFDPTGEAKTVEPLVLTEEQRAAVNEAVAELRADYNDHTMTEGECVRIVCQRYVSRD